MGYIGEVVKRVKKAIKAYQAPARSQDLLKWQKRLEVAKGGQNLGLMDKRELLYLGDRRVDKNVNATTNPSKMANNIYNIIYEFIETMVSRNIPQLQVKSKREGFEQQAQMIADSINNDMRESDIETIDDQNERITPLQGFSIVEVCWNPDFKHHLYKGNIELYGKHPKQLVTQPKVYNLHKMDYFFILSDVTQDYVERRYGKLLEGEEEQYPENTRLFDSGILANNGVTQRSGGEYDDEPMTEIVCWYRDDEGDIGKFTWINDIELENLPKYFYRRIKGKIVETEVLQEDVISPTGQLIARAGETVPYYVPQRYPVSVRINVPINFAFGGQSDLDVIRDQQDSIKRVIHKMEEKLIKGGTLILAQNDHTTFNIDDTIYQIIRGTAQELAVIKTLDLTADISKDLEFIQEQYKVAQSMLGITNSFQGKEDPTAQSGVAKQIQVQQASGRMLSKQFNKYVHYKEIFEIIFELKLSLYDEVRPYLAQDVNGKDVYGQFDKYQFLQRDKRGNLYYNTDFIFGSDGSMGLPKDPMFMYNQTLALFEAQAIDPVQLWTILESLQFPQASKIKEQVQQRMDQQAQIQQMQQKIEQDQQEMQVLQEMVNQLHGHIQDSQGQNGQTQNDTLKTLQDGQQQDREHQVNQQQRQQELDQQNHQQQLDIAQHQLSAQQQAHSQGLDQAKLILEAHKVQQLGQKQETDAKSKSQT